MSTFSGSRDGDLGSPSSLDAPLPKEVIASIVEPHLGRLGSVLTRAWDDFVVTRDAPTGHLTRIRAASQGMVISDLLAEPARAQFAGVPGAEVVMRFDRPWVHLDGGRAQVRFRSLTPTLGICPGQSDRAVRLAFQMPDDTLDIEVPPEGTVLTAGFVLDPSRLRIQRLALVCHVGFNKVHYWFPLPGGDIVAAPTQMPLAPLSDPIIRSAQAAAVKRLAERGDSA